VSESNGQTGVFSNSASSTASEGILKLYATNQETGYVVFAGAVADAGWNDTLTIPGPAGQTGIWQAQVLVTGQMQLDLSSSPGYSATGTMDIEAFEGGSRLTDSTDLAAYNTFLLVNNGDHYGSSISYGWNYQMVEFDVEDADNTYFQYGPPKTLLDLVVNQVVTFEVPFTYNVPFEFGLWADAKAGEGSSGAYPQDATVNFSQTMLWDGSGILAPDGTGPLNKNFTVESTSGFDYVDPIPTPEPGTLGVCSLCFAFAALAAKRLRRL
jgi:hypothetical protein